MNTTEIIPAGAASDAPALSPYQPPQVNTAAAMTRAQAEVQAQYLMAMRMPRDEAAAAAAIVSACRRPSFAPDVEYKFPRGGSEVSGPSIYFAREASRIWGRIRSGVAVLELTEEDVLIEATAVDMQSMRIQTAQMRSKLKIQRKQKSGKTEWVQPDERDFAELVNRVGAKLERNCLLALLPSDIIEDAVRTARETNQRIASGDLDKDRASTIRGILAAFADYGVMKPHIEKKIGHPLEAASPQEIADLRAAYKTIKDGSGNAAELFDLAPPATAAEVKTGDALAATRAKVDALKQGQSAPAAQGAA